MALENIRCDLRCMTIDVRPEASTADSAAAEVDDLVAALRPRLVDEVGPAEVDRLVREARADLGEVRVTTYLPILVERRVRARVRMGQTIELPEARVSI
jgi:hypothetical protein